MTAPEGKELLIMISLRKESVLCSALLKRRNKVHFESLCIEICAVVVSYFDGIKFKNYHEKNVAETSQVEIYPKHKLDLT